MIVRRESRIQKSKISHSVSEKFLSMWSADTVQRDDEMRRGGGSCG